MKIVHAVYGLEMGGAEVLVAQLCRLQRAAGHEVSIFSYARLGVVGEALKAEGFPIYIPGEAPPLKTIWRYFQRFRQVRPDVVHCHGLAPTIHAVLPGRLTGARCVLSTRHRLEYHPYDFTAEIQYNVMCWFADAVAGICQTTCDNMRRGPLVWKKKIVCVYNGTLPVIRADFAALGKTGFTAVFIGRVVPEKSLDTLIRAVALARQRIPGMALWLVGGGYARPELEALVAELGVGDAVRFWGQQIDTAPFFSAADVFTMSSISEGLPMSLLQSMSLGTPAILTDVDGMGEILRLTGSGLLVPVGDHAAMADALVRMAQDDTLRVELSRLALEAYQHRFTLETMAAGYMTLYRGNHA
jgi:glycosyltransferase involved in cell wall biosynthesis